VVWDADQQRQIEVLTNHLGFGATTLAAIYRERWQIELFFKALKQNLKVKTLVGTTENALRIQLWTALLALLLLKWLHFLSTAGWSLSNLASLLRLNFFTYRDLHDWLAKPLETPPLLPDCEQLPLSLPVPGQLPA
jgi:IS4 transposase